jgi:hypothetical protein
VPAKVCPAGLQRMRWRVLARAWLVGLERVRWVVRVRLAGAESRWGNREVAGPVVVGRVVNWGLM